jgi:hypothetical protein
VLNIRIRLAQRRGPSRPVGLISINRLALLAMTVKTIPTDRDISQAGK